MTDREKVLDALRRFGAARAAELQSRAGEMSGTALYAEEEYLPAFAATRARKNVLERSIGFTCISTAGRVVSLLQPYDSDTYPQEPEELAAQWRFKWSTDPRHALPFEKITNSPYNKGDCCVWEGKVMRSKIDSNTYSPEEHPDGWEEVINE